MSHLTSQVKLSRPTSVFVSRNNEIYIADTDNYRIRKVLRNGKIVTIAGTGKEECNAEEGPATSVNIHPVSLFVTSNNEVYFADTRNHRIRKILPNGHMITIAGTGKPGYSGDGGPAVEAQLLYPNSVFVEYNEVYIADTDNNRIRKILRNGNIVTIAGTGRKGYNNEERLATTALLSYPTCVIVHNKEVYIADQKNNRIRKILQNGKITTIAGSGRMKDDKDGPVLCTQLKYPYNMFISNNELYFTEYEGHRIRKVENGNIVTVAGTGKRGDGGNGGLATQAQLEYPTSVFVSNNEIYISESDKIRKILPNGK